MAVWTRMTCRVSCPTDEEEYKTGRIVLERRRTASGSNLIDKKNKHCPFKMSIVFVPKKQRGTAKINQETIQRVSERQT